MVLQGEAEKVWNIINRMLKYEFLYDIKDAYAIIYVNICIYANTFVNMH